jgi:predicted RNA-binding protein with PIN domain
VELSGDRLFRRALEAAARALRDLDADQVPADLRRVTGRPPPLPPPLALSLLKGIDRYDWLREKALEAWPEADAKEAGPDQASALLLLRPPGWVSRILALAVGAAGEEARGAGDDLARRLAAAEAATEEWKRRARAEKDSGARARQQAEVALAEERSAHKVRQATAARADAGLEAEVERLRAAGEDARAERDAAREELRRVRETLAEEKRKRGEAESARAEAAGTARWAGDPLSMALHLDWTAGVARVGGSGGPGEETGPGGVLRLPEGVRPDEKAAVDWLVQRVEATVVIVDGYNAAFKLTTSRDPAAARRRLMLALGRLQQVARGPLRVVAVFDSRLGTAGEVPAPGPVEVRFTAEEGGADAEIAVLTASLGGARVVVSSDRAVREAVETAGALALWSEALREWSRRR